MRLLSGLLAFGLWAAPAAKLKITPENPLLFGQGSRQRLVVTAEYPDGTAREVTAEAAFTAAGPAARVDPQGVVTALANGGSPIRVTWQGHSATTTALVQRAAAPIPRSFAADILPILTKYGCNGGSCHGALNGKNGFKLSLFGFEPEPDYDMIATAHNGRRVNRTDPEKSLLLLKPTMGPTPHGGGKLFSAKSPDYQALLAWLRDGAPRTPQHERKMTALRVTPATLTLTGKDASRKLLVTARFDDGAEADVTHLVKFSTNNDSIASINPAGIVKAERGGETAIVVRGPGVAGVAKVAVVLEPRAVAPLPVSNLIDEHSNAKLKRLQIPPSAPADDATFLRRVYLDIIGTIPTSAEARAFLASKDPAKRAKAVDQLLHRPEYAEYWAMYWGDHLDNTKQLLYNKGPYAFTEYLQKQFRANVPYDQFVRSLLVSSGNMYEAPATNYYPIMKKELDLAEKTSQLFLGVSIGCARCHNHPLERWKQSDFAGLAAFFSQVRYKGGGPRNNERALVVDFSRQFQHPETKKVYLPKALDGPQLAPEGLTDRRELLAAWITAKDNPYFARAMVNRMWRLFFGRGFVEPVDDFRVTNPPSNEPLLDALARDFAAHNFDLHHLIKTITLSSAYQLSSVPVPGNKQDTMAYSRYYPKRLSAEPLLDAISLATAVPESFRAMYPGTRAAALPEPEIESYFLEVFDRPSRQLVCERKNEPTLNQALHMIGGDTAHRKVTSTGSYVRLALGQFADDGALVEEFYLRTLTRFPDAEELAAARNAIRKAANRQQGAEDVLWALLNTKEFLYNH
jgi:hypothetical protein